MMAHHGRSDARALAGAMCTFALVIAGLVVGMQGSAHAACVLSVCTSPSPSPKPSATHSPSPSPKPSPSATSTPSPEPSGGGVPAPVVAPFPSFSPGPGAFPSFNFNNFPTPQPQPLPRTTQTVNAYQPYYPPQNFLGGTARVSQPLRSGSDTTLLRAILFLLAAGAGLYTLRRARVRRWQIGI